MPYYLHERNTEPHTGRPYSVKSEALEDRVDGQTVSYVPTRGETGAWHVREQDRVLSGYYTKLPSTFPVVPEHFAHVSRDEPGMLAYTPDAEHGHADRQKRVRPGRYLKQYFSHLSAAEITEICSVYTAHVTQDLPLAQTADEIVAVYTLGPRSCMGGRDDLGREKDRDYFEETGGIHPCEVYADGDLAVAYLGNIRNVSARAVVWPDRKVWARLYGDEDALQDVLERQGYREGSLRGARVRALEISDGRYVMPYVDGISYAALDESGDYFILGRGSYATDSTDGTTGARRLCDRDGCDEPRDEYNPYCDDCESDRWCCEHCGDDYFDTAEAILVDGSYYCESCADRYRQECAVCGDTWHASDSADICASCDRTHSWCDECDAYTDDYPGCHAEPEDDETDDDTEDDDPPAADVAPLSGPYVYGIPAPIPFVRVAVPSNATVPARVEAIRIDGPFAVHRTITPGAKPYVVTHRPTGLAVCNLETPQDAASIARALQAPGVDWNFHTAADMTPSAREHGRAIVHAL